MPSNRLKMLNVALELIKLSRNREKWHLAKNTQTEWDRLSTETD